MNIKFTCSQIAFFSKFHFSLSFFDCIHPMFRIIKRHMEVVSKITNLNISINLRYSRNENENDNHIYLKFINLKISFLNK